MSKFIKLIGSRRWKIYRVQNGLSEHHNGLQIKAISRKSIFKKELKNWTHLFEEFERY